MITDNASKWPQYACQIEIKTLLTFTYAYDKLKYAKTPQHTHQAIMANQPLRQRN